MTNAVMSNMTIDIAARCGVSPSSLLKNAAIVYDKTYFHTGSYGMFSNAGWTSHNLLLSWIEVSEKLDGKAGLKGGIATYIP